MSQSNNSKTFNKASLARFYIRYVNGLPEYYSVMDSTRITALYFCIVGLDILDMLSSIETMKPKIIDYIYAMQLKPKPHFKGHKGFLGSYMGQPFGSCLCGYIEFSLN